MSTEEDTIFSQILEVLQGIKAELLITGKDKPVKYRISSFEGVGLIPKNRRIKILHKLEEEGAFAIQRLPSGRRIGSDDIYYLIINQSGFEKVHEKYLQQNKANSLVKIPIEKKQTALEFLEIIATDLDTKFAEIEKEKNESQFLMSVAGYGKYLIETKNLHHLFKELHTQSEKDILPYKNACDKFYKEWCLLAKNLVELAEKAGIKDDLENPLKSQIYFIKTKLKEKPPYNDKYIDSYYMPYWELTRKFENNKKDLIKEHFKAVDGIQTLKIETLRQQASDEWDKFKTLREGQTWWAHYQIMRLTHGVFDLKENDPYYDNDNIIDTIYRHHFEQISRGESQSYQMLKRENFEKWINRLHKFIIPRLRFLGVMKNFSEMANSSLEGIKRQMEMTTSFMKSPLDGIKFTPGMFENQEVRLLREIRDGMKDAKEPENKYLMKLPSGTVWENIILKFKNEEKVLIKVKGKEYHFDFRQMQFADSRYSDPRPNVAWEFLKLLAKNNGEIVPKNAKDKSSYIKLKQKLSDTLKSIFPIEYDPFWRYEPYPPYKSGYSYKIKISLIPPPENLNDMTIKNEEQEDVKDVLDQYTS